MARRLAAVFAHPDDDTYAVAGTAAIHADDGIEVLVTLATSGEAGQIVDPRLTTPENLGSVREAEDRASWEEVGVRAEHRFLGYPDGGLATVPRSELVQRIESVLAEFRPGVVVTFGPDGITGHEDHIAVGEAATEAFHRARRASPPGPSRLLHSALPQRVMDRWAAVMVEHGMEPPDPTAPFQPRAVPDEGFGVRVDCSAVYERKLAAVRRHRTQGEMQDVPVELWPIILGEENFVLAWPEHEPGDPVLTDVFQALPPT
jgi:LmbE family N-acetylglucosaminyl deacetylase